MKIVKAKNYTDLSRKAANILSAQVILNPKSVIGLATGSTPIGMYKQLINWFEKEDIDFSQVKTFNLDEYIGIESTHPQSYHTFMNDTFFNHINIDYKNISIPNGMSTNHKRECHRYESKIKDAGGIDLQILGIGNNGHIGFNEPGAHFHRDTHVVALTDDTRKANARFFTDYDDVPSHAISMGIGTIMKAKRIVLLCSGKNKADILYKTFYGKIDPQVPASVLQLHSDLTIVADQEALLYFKDI